MIKRIDFDTAALGTSFGSFQTDGWHKVTLREETHLSSAGLTCRECEVLGPDGVVTTEPDVEAGHVDCLWDDRAAFELQLETTAKTAEVAMDHLAKVLLSRGFTFRMVAPPLEQQKYGAVFHSVITLNLRAAKRLEHGLAAIG